MVAELAVGLSFLGAMFFTVPQNTARESLESVRTLEQSLQKNNSYMPFHCYFNPSCITLSKSQVSVFDTHNLMGTCIQVTFPTGSCLPLLRCRGQRNNPHQIISMMLVNEQAGCHRAIKNGRCSS